VRERRAYATYIAEAATARAVGEERMRIAREVHDIVAHTMSVIAVKATIADHLADEHPQEMREALRVIGSTSRGALAELRVALGVLRTDVPLAPTPGMDDLAGLVEIAEAAGMTVDLDVRGDAEVPDGMAQAVFRIVQESLTNVVKHAEGATHCAVSIHVSPVEVRIEAVDDGHPVPARAVDAGTATATAGQGLIGMRERVALFGGRFAAGPRQPHGWSVSATLRCEGGAGVE
jgi:signal transduction histidine kinase